MKASFKKKYQIFFSKIHETYLIFNFYINLKLILLIIDMYALFIYLLVLEKVKCFCFLTNKSIKT